MTTADDTAKLRLEGRRRKIDQSLMVEYTDTLGFRNPIHYGGDFAKVSEFKGPIASGPFALALIDDLMMSRFPLSWLTRAELAVAFVAPVRPDDVVRAEADLTGVEADDNGTRLIFAIRCVSD